MATQRRHSPVADALSLCFAAGLTAGFLLRWPGSAGSRSRLLIALGTTLAFALAAWFARGVSASGALAGMSIAFVMAASTMKLFWLLLVVFAVTLGATRLGRSRKERLHVAEYRKGRSAAQVMANLGIAGFIVAFAPPAWRLLALAAMAELAADTSSSETGQAFPGRTLLITTLKPIAPGIDGGISFNGTLAAVVASGIIALTARVLGLATTHQAAVIAACGTLGMLIDSILGAVLERRGYLTNDLVNLLGTASAAGIAWLLL